MRKHTTEVYGSHSLLLLCVEYMRTLLYIHAFLQNSVKNRHIMSIWYTQLRYSLAIFYHRYYIHIDGVYIHIDTLYNILYIYVDVSTDNKQILKNDITLLYLLTQS